MLHITSAAKHNETPLKFSLPVLQGRPRRTPPCIGSAFLYCFAVVYYCRRFSVLFVVVALGFAVVVGFAVVAAAAVSVAAPVVAVGAVVRPRKC